MSTFRYRRRHGLTRDQQKVAGVAVAAALLLAAHGYGASSPAASSAAAHAAHMAHLADTSSGAVMAAAGPAPSGGSLSCSGLEALWESAGGAPSEAQMAASIAMAESSGQLNPPSNAGSNSNGMTDVGVWQINSGIWPALATTDPLGNARAAIQISHNGTDWSPWVTYQIGANAGKC